MLGLLTTAFHESAAQTFNSTTNSGLWSSSTFWNGAAPTTGGATGAIVNFKNPAVAITATNDLEGSFLLNQINFNNANVSLYGNDLVFSANGTNAAKVNLTGGGNVFAIYNNLVLATNTIFGGNKTNNVTLTLGGTISGPGTLVATGAYKVLLTNVNSYTGGTWINGGLVALGSDAPTTPTENVNSLGTNIVTITSGGQLRLGGNNGNTTFNITNAIVLDNGKIAQIGGVHHLQGTVTVNAGGGLLLTRNSTRDLYLDAGVVGSGPLTVDWEGTGSGGAVHFTNTSKTYSGILTINGGATGGFVYVDANVALSNATVNMNGIRGLGFATGVTAPVFAALSGSGNFSLTDGAGTAALLNVGGNNSNTAYSGSLSGAGGLTKAGSGTFLLSGSNSYTGLTTISNGTLVAGNFWALQNSTVIANADSRLGFQSYEYWTFLLGGLSGTGNIGLSNMVGGSIDLRVGNNGSSTVYSGSLSGYGSLTKVGSGTLTLSGSNSYTGGTVINGGVLVFSSTAASPTLNSITINSGGSLAATGAYNSVADWLKSGSINPASGGAIALTSNSAEPIGLDASLGAYSNISLGASGNIIYTGNLTPNGVMYRLGGGGTLVLPNDNAITNIHGNAGLVVASGSGIVVLQGSNSFTGGTTLGIGSTLRISSAANIGGIGSEVIFNGGTLQVSGTSLTNFSELLANWGTFNSGLDINNPANTFAFTNNTYGNGILTKSGSGTLLLNGHSALNRIIVNQGAVNVQSSEALAASLSQSLVNTGAVLQLQGGVSLPATPLLLNGSGTASDGALRSLDGDNTVAGAITLGNTVRINSDTGSLILSGNLNNNGYSLTIGGAGNTIASGIIGGTGSVTKDDEGTLSLSANNTYTGATVVTDGTLALVFINGSTPNILAPASPVTLSGGRLSVLGDPVSGIGAQQINTLAIGTGNSVIAANDYSALYISNITRAVGSGIVDFNLPGGTGSITTSISNNYAGLLNALATVGGTNWAAAIGTGPYSIGNYSGFADATSFIPDDSNVNLRILATSDATIPFAAGGYTNTINSIQVNDPAPHVIDLSGTNVLRLGITGGVLAAPGSGGLQIGTVPNDGFLTAGGSRIGAGEIVFINNSSSPILVNAGLTNNGTGALTVTVNGTGTVSFTGNNTYSGATYINSGVVNLSGSNNLGAFTARDGVVTFLSSNTNLLGGTTLSGNTILTNNGLTSLLVGANSNNLTIANVSGDRALFVNGSGSLAAKQIVLGAANGAAGAFIQTGGVVQATVSGNALLVGSAAGGYGYYLLSNGIVNAPAGTIMVGQGGAGQFDVVGGVLNNSGWLQAGANASGIGVINLSGGIVFNQVNGLLAGNVGPGVINISGSAYVKTPLVFLNWVGSLFTNVVNLNGGVLITPTVNAKAASINNYFNFNGGLLQASAAGTLMQNLSAACIWPGGAWIDSSNFNVTVSQALSSPSGFGLTSIAVAEGGSGYIGSPVVAIGGGNGVGATAVAQIDYATGSVTNIVITSAGTGYLSNDVLTISLIGGGYSRSAQIGTFSFGTNTAGALTKLGAGTLTLSSLNNTYTGGTVLGAGTLSVSNDFNFGGPSSALTFSGGVLQITGTTLTNIDSHAVNWSIFNGGFDIANPANVFTLTNVIAGSGGLVKLGTGTLVLSGANTYTGATFINGGALQFASPSSIAGLGVNVLIGTGGVAAAGYPLDQAFLSRIDTGSAGAVALTADSSNALDLSTAGANLTNNLGAVGFANYSGVLTPNGSIYRLGGGGGTLALTNINALSGNNSLFAFGNGLTGVLLLASSNNYTGGTILSNGTLRLGDNNALGTGNLTLNGGTLASDGNAARTLTNALVIAGNARFGDAVGTGDLTNSGPVNLGTAARTLTVSNRTVFSGGVVGSGVVTKAGAGTLGIQGGGVWDRGATAIQVNDGTLIFDGTTVTNADAYRIYSTVPGGTARLVITNGAALYQTMAAANFRIGYTGGNVTATNIADIAGIFRVVAPNAANGNVQMGTASGAAILNLLSGGVLTTRAITNMGSGYTEFNFNGGTLVPYANSAVFLQGLSNAFIRSGGAIIDSTNFNVTIGQSLLNGGGNGGLTKLGTGSLTLTGSNTYTGATVVNSGGLIINGYATGGGALSAAKASITLDGATGYFGNIALATNSILTNTTTATLAIAGNFDNAVTNRKANFDGTFLFNGGGQLQQLEVASAPAIGASNFTFGSLLIGDPVSGRTASVSLVNNRQNLTSGQEILSASNLSIIAGSTLDLNNQTTLAFNLSNLGTIAATNVAGSAAPVVRLDVVNTFANQGVIQVGNGSVLQLSNAFLNGYSGNVQLVGESVLTNFIAGGVLTNQGAIVGDGVIVPEISNAGTIAATGGLLHLSGGFADNAALGGKANEGLLLALGAGTELHIGQSFLNAGTIASSNASFTASGSVQNKNRIAADRGSLTINGSVINDAGAVIEAAAESQLQIGGDLQNFGALYLNSSTAVVSGTLTLAASGVIRLAGSNDTLVVRGDFINASTNSAGFDVSRGTISIGGGIQPLSGAAHTFEVGSTNRGATAEGFADNFAIGTLNIKNSTLFTDSVSNGGSSTSNEVLYVDVLHLFAGSTLSLSSLTIYIGQAFIDDNTGQIFTSGTINSDNIASLGLGNVSLEGGQIIFVPEPSTYILLSAGFALLFSQIRRKNRMDNPHKRRQFKENR